MENKYKNFLNYKWESSNDWQLYYSNLFPVPTSNKILHYKKKFYKLKIDNDFDTNYSPEESTPGGGNANNTNNTNTNSNTNNAYRTNSSSSENQNQNQGNYNYNRTTYNQYNHSSNQNYSQPRTGQDLYISNVESFSWLLCFVSIFFQYHTYKIALFCLLIRVFRVNGAPKWNVNYLQQLFNDVHFHICLYTLIFMVERFLLFGLIPLLITGALNISEFFVINRLNPEIARDYANRVYTKRDYLSTLRSNIEIGIGFFLIVGVFLGVNSFFTTLFFWQYLKFKHSTNEQYTLRSFTKLGNLIDSWLNNPQVPDLVKTILAKVKQLGIYFGSTSQNAHQRAGAGQSCIVF